MRRTTFSFPFLIEERSGVRRAPEPISFGVPFPQGEWFNAIGFQLIDSSGYSVPVQAQALAHWSDGSIKWLLVDFQANLEAREQRSYYLTYHATHPESPFSPLIVQQLSDSMIVDTGQVRFFLNCQIWKPFDKVVIRDKDLLGSEGSCVVFTDASDHIYEPVILAYALETSGPLRVTVRAEGELRAERGRGSVRFISRLSFFANSGLVELKVTLHNPRAAHHPGGLWDLGDEGSIYFKDFSLHLPMVRRQARKVAWMAHPSETPRSNNTSSLVMYQDSSGGENWQSSNHVNRYGQVTNSFRGYRVLSEEGRLEEGLRATPVLALSNGEHSIAATIEQFWQNFPKAIETTDNQLILRLFPQQYNDVFELQGGEQKTHTLYLQFGGADLGPESLSWVHDRLTLRVEPEWYERSRACLFVSSRDVNQESACEKLIDTAITGPQSFFARREIIDEYGWRHFGDLYADHEAVRHTGATPLVAHYNNQYDVVYGAIVQYLRGGDRCWFELARDLVRHVIDIDIYHTQEDRFSYNGGLFWHTDHYFDAATVTHRAYSKVNQEKHTLPSYGGGPANEQNYTTGLLYYYFLTGDVAAREAVLELANWVIAMDNGSSRYLGFVDKRPTGAASATADRNYHGPGRGAGNSINALLDASILTSDEQYLTKAEQIIRRCIHPRDDISERSLEDVEHRWSYTVFLQMLGKYLELKAEQNALDYMYGYAQASLLHYAEWMLEHEVPYSQVLDRVEIPTETWSAQDIRKSCVLYLAAKHATEPVRSAFRERADFFFHTCINDLHAWETRTLTRPLVLMMTNAYVQNYFHKYAEECAPQPLQTYDFGAPQRFKPQFAELYWTREKAQTIVRGVKNSMNNLFKFSSRSWLKERDAKGERLFVSKEG